MYFHCQTTLIGTFKEMYPGRFEFGGNRSIIFGGEDALPENALRHCIAMALTYRLDKKRSARTPANTRIKRRSTGRAKAACR